MHEEKVYAVQQTRSEAGEPVWVAPVESEIQPFSASFFLPALDGTQLLVDIIKFSDGDVVNYVNELE